MMQKIDSQFNDSRKTFSQDNYSEIGIIDLFKKIQLVVCSNLDQII